MRALVAAALLIHGVATFAATFAAPRRDRPNRAADGAGLRVGGRSGDGRRAIGHRALRRLGRPFRRPDDAARLHQDAGRLQRCGGRGEQLLAQRAEGAELKAGLGRRRSRSAAE
ncbi:MAG: hypothetical protein IPL88_03415 [Rhizobiales bacterium]|nr:hypothetical protein [Hyphomicrobiales bacterium]